MRWRYPVAKGEVEAHDLFRGQRRCSNRNISQRTPARRLHRILAVPFAAIAWILAGCASLPAGDPTLLEFLKPGDTTRDQIVARLGVPTSQFEQGRIVIYPLGSRRGGYALGWPENWRTEFWTERSRPVGRFHLIIELNV